MEPKIIIVGADFGATGEQAIRVGLEHLSAGFAQGLHVVHVLDVSAEPFPTDEPAQDPDGPTIALVRESLTRHVSAVAAKHHLPYHSALVRVEVRKGEVHEALVAAAREHHADLLIVGSHGRHGLNRWVAGSVSETLVRAAECSVLVARPPRHASHQRAVDDVETTRDPARHFDAGLLAELREQASRGEKPWRPADELGTRRPASEAPER